MSTAGTAATQRVHWPGPPAEPCEMQRAERILERLRPRDGLRLPTLEIAGGFLAGRAVGGDFYDFLRPSPRRLVLILGDVSGHGLAAALLMAALHASVRAHYALSPAELVDRIESLNRLFFDSTAAEHYAGLFVGEYDDASRRLRYANCGHPAPLLVRAGGDVERLAPTGTVLGLFESWNGSVGDVGLAPGDRLVAVTDGVVEAVDHGEGEFGELRLLSSILRNRHLDPRAMIRAIARDVRLACGRRPLDDATVVVARARESTSRTSG